MNSGEFSLPELPTSAQDLLGRARILVVDDSRMLRMGISRSLRELGVQNIEEAADGIARAQKARAAEDAILKVRTKKPPLSR